MQAIKEKMNDIHAMRKAKAELKEEEKAEKEMAKERVEAEKKMAKERLEVVHEIRLAKEAKAEMDLHANKAKEKVAGYDGADDHDLHPIAYLQP